MPTSTPQQPTSPEALTGLNPEQIQALLQAAAAQAQQITAKLPVLGPVVWLMMQTASHKYIALHELEARVLPAIVLNQMRLFMQPTSTVSLNPVALSAAPSAPPEALSLQQGLPMVFMAWAFLSPEAAERYQKTGKLALGDWRSGGDPSVAGANDTTCQWWLIESVAPYGGLEEAIRTLRESYPSKALNLLGAALGNASPVRLPAIAGGAVQ